MEFLEGFQLRQLTCFIKNEKKHTYVTILFGNKSYDLLHHKISPYKSKLNKRGLYIYARTRALETQTLCFGISQHFSQNVCVAARGRAMQEWICDVSTLIQKERKNYRKTFSKSNSINVWLRSYGKKLYRKGCRAQCQPNKGEEMDVTGKDKCKRQRNMTEV